jgi:Tol biopolymer transport system component
MLVYLAIGCARKPSGQGSTTVLASGGSIRHPSVFSDPVWSPDGQSIAVILSDADSTLLETLDANGRRESILLNEIGAMKSPGWVGPNVIFLTGLLKHAALERIASNRREMVLALPGAISASWSRSGRYGIFERYQESDSTDSLWLLDTDTMSMKEVLSGVMPNYFRISPSGRYVAVSSNDMSGGTVLVQDIQTGDVTHLWHIDRSEGAVGYIAWSPDERFVGVRRVGTATTRGFYLLARDGSSSPFRLTSVEFVSPDWSPDGTRIVYATVGTPGRNALCVMTLPADWQQKVLAQPR